MKRYNAPESTNGANPYPSDTKGTKSQHAPSAIDCARIADKWPYRYAGLQYFVVGTLPMHLNTVWYTELKYMDCAIELAEMEAE